MMSYVGMNPVGPVAPNNVSFGDALRRAGLNPVEVTLALPYLFLAPAGCDPDMQAVQAIIKGLQNVLNRAGYSLVPDGHLGPDTAAALNRLSPPSGSYASKPWFQIYADVLARVAAGARAVSSRVVKVGALGDVSVPSVASVTTGGPAPTCDVWDFACQAQKLASGISSTMSPPSIPPALIAGGVFLGLVLLTSRKKGRR